MAVSNKLAFLQYMVTCLNQHRASMTERSNAHAVYTWRYTLTGLKLNNNLTQYSRLTIFGSVTKTLSRNYTKRKVFPKCTFCEKLRFIHFAQRTSVKSNKSSYLVKLTYSENFTLSVVPAQCLDDVAKKLLAQSTGCSCYPTLRH